MQGGVNNPNNPDEDDNAEAHHARQVVSSNASAEFINKDNIKLEEITPGQLLTVNAAALNTCFHSPKYRWMHSFVNLTGVVTRVDLNRGLVSLMFYFPLTGTAIRAIRAIYVR